MPTRVVALNLVGGHTVLAEVDSAPAPTEVPQSLVEAPTIDFAAEVDKVKALAEQIHGALAAIDPLPSSYQVSFGITLTAGAGVVLAKAGAEASFTVTLNWGA